MTDISPASWAAILLALFAGLLPVYLRNRRR